MRNVVKHNNKLHNLITRLDPTWSKETYLEWRKDWRNAYKRLVVDIRESKRRKRLKGDGWYDTDQREWGQYTHAKQAQVARSLLAIRRTSKIYARLASRQGNI